MNEQTLVDTRRSLHGVAELLLAGPQHRAHGTIRLRVTPGGFGCVASDLRVSGTSLVWPGGEVGLAGSCRELAAVIGVDAGPPDGVYSDTSGLAGDAALTVDREAAELLADWFARGDSGLRTLVASGLPADAAEPGESAPEPVLWPEHFDLGVTLDEVNYGVSPGDAAHPRPYAYVGPWQVPTGPFWNAPFGALRPIDELPDADAISAFFLEGRATAAR